MVNEANAPPLTPDNTNPLHSEQHSGPSQYDGNELLLLQLADINHEPLSSELETVVEDKAPYPTSGKPSASLLMERPRSSGIDMTGFSFSKPVQRGRNFSLRTSKEETSTPFPQRNVFHQESQNLTEEIGKHCGDSREE